ncbi:MAG: four helix bundle protein [Actinobacteria bacterium]|nr:four helix bundle protein [Actinomycetota bacterium]
MREFRKLKVWERSHRLTLATYKATATFPREELYGLTSQIRRSCAAIPANIAEGCGRGTNADLARFLQMALGSVSELECHLLLARDLAFLEEADYERLAREVTEIKRMLTSFIKSLRTFANPSSSEPPAT